MKKQETNHQDYQDLLNKLKKKQEEIDALKQAQISETKASEYAYSTAFNIGLIASLLIVYPFQFNGESSIHWIFSIISLFIYFVRLKILIRYKLASIMLEYCYWVLLATVAIGMLHSYIHFSTKFQISFLINSLGCMPTTFRVFRFSYQFNNIGKFALTLMHKIPLLFALYLRFLSKGSSPNLLSTDQWEEYLKDKQFWDLYPLGLYFYYTWFVLYTLIVIILVDPILRKRGYLTYWQLTIKNFKLFEIFRNLFGIKETNVFWNKASFLVVHSFLGTVSVAVGTYALLNWNVSLSLMAFVFIHSGIYTYWYYKDFLRQNYGNFKKKLS